MTHPIITQWSEHLKEFGTIPESGQNELRRLLRILQPHEIFVRQKLISLLNPLMAPVITTNDNRLVDYIVVQQDNYARVTRGYSPLSDIQFDAAHGFYVRLRITPLDEPSE